MCTSVNLIDIFHW